MAVPRPKLHVSSNLQIKGVELLRRKDIENYMAKRMRNATIRQNRPMASDRAKPKMA